MSRLTRICCVAVAATLAAGALPAQEETDGFGVAKKTALATVRRMPQAFKNVWVRFTGQYVGLGTLHNPFFTRFTRADFVNFAVWDDRQKIWQREEYDDPCSTFFCPKTNDRLLTTIYGLQRYQRIKVTGVVRNAFRGEPWIEVTELEPIEQRVTTATLTHMSRAYKLIQGHRWQQAAVELNLAASQSLTDHARGWIHGYLGLCLMRVGRPNEALLQLDAAKRLLVTATVIDDWIAALADDPRRAVDTKVRVSVPKGGHPMWEAVDKAAEEGGRKGTRGPFRRPIPVRPPDLEEKVPASPGSGISPRKPATAPAKPGK